MKIVSKPDLEKIVLLSRIIYDHIDEYSTIGTT